MVTKLVVASGKNAGRTIAIKRNRLLIGRAEECDVRPLSEDVSRRHCEVVVGPSDAFIQDLGSRNGTFVNGARITERTKLADGDLIRVGVLELKVSCTDPAAKAGTEDDVSRWLMADDKPAGMFDTTRTLSDRDAAAAPTLLEPAAGDAAAGTSDSNVHATVPAGGDSPSGLTPEPDSSAIQLQALKAGRGKPGTLPPKDKKAADSSRDAAAQALKKFFDNR